MGNSQNMRNSRNMWIYMILCNMYDSENAYDS